MGTGAGPEPIEIELTAVAPIGDHSAHASDPTVDRGPTVAERLVHGGELLREGFEHARDLHARKGPRPGAVPSSSSTRAGHGTDIVRPVLIDPRVACELALTGGLFDGPIPHLAVEQPGDGRSLTWRATVRCGRRMRRATLHLMASPSELVTVIELVPTRRLRRGRRRFVADGVEAVEAIAGRLERAGQRSGSGSGSACTTDSRCVDRVSAT